MYLQFFRVILEALVSLLLSLFSLVFLNYLDVFSCFLARFSLFSLFFETFLADALFFTLLAPMRPKKECQRGAAELGGVRKCAEMVGPTPRRAYKSKMFNHIIY